MEGSEPSIFFGHQARLQHNFGLFQLGRGSPPGESIAFFLYDVPKILLLLGGTIFLITIMRTFFSAERIEQWAREIEAKESEKEEQTE